MSNPSYAVVYFPIRGRAEPIRLLLASLGLPFEDRDIVRERWMETKATLPLGQAPVLIETSADGGETMIPQSQAILRHLARVHGRYGRDESEMLRADVLAETVHDVRAILAPFAAPNTRGKDPAGLRQAVDEKLPLGLSRLEKLHGDASSDLFVEQLPTWADCLAYDLLSTLDEIAPASLAPFPGLRAFLVAMNGHPSLSAYLASRRPSELAVLKQVLESGQAV